jgi:hypothetical protein
MLARHIAIGFGIAVIFPLLVYYGVSTYHPAPKRLDFFETAEVPPYTGTPQERKEYEDKRRKAQQAFNTAAKEFSRVLVIVATPLGVAAILIGAYLPIHGIGIGLILGGIGTVGYGYWSYWEHLEDWARFVSLLAGFAILLFVGYRRLAVRRPNSGTS